MKEQQINIAELTAQISLMFTKFMLVVNTILTIHSLYIMITTDSNVAERLVNIALVVMMTLLWQYYIQNILKRDENNGN